MVIRGRSYPLPCFSLSCTLSLLLWLIVTMTVMLPLHWMSSWPCVLYPTGKPAHALTFMLNIQWRTFTQAGVFYFPNLRCSRLFVEFGKTQNTCGAIAKWTFLYILSVPLSALLPCTCTLSSFYHFWKNITSLYSLLGDVCVSPPPWWILPYLFISYLELNLILTWYQLFTLNSKWLVIGGRPFVPKRETQPMLLC